MTKDEFLELCKKYNSIFLCVNYENITSEEFENSIKTSRFFEFDMQNKNAGEKMTNAELKKEQEDQEIQTILCPYGYVDGANQCGCCEHFSDNGDGTECCGLQVGLNAYRLIYNHGYRKAKEVRKGIVIDICADMFRFLFPDEKRQCDMHDIVEFCNKWYVKVGLLPYDESAKEKYKSEIIEDD